MDEEQSAYAVTTTDAGHRLETRIPVPPGWLYRGTSILTGKDYSPRETPPGETDGSWVRRNTWYYPQTWGSYEEFWLGWLLLDIYSIDRQHHTSPLGLQSSGVATLFSTFHNDRFTAYYPPEVGDELGQALSGTTSDSLFGLFFRVWPLDTLVAASVDPGSAAWKAGLRNDDRLLRFDHRWAATSLKYLGDTAAHRPVLFEILRAATGIIDTMTITRSPHIMPTLYADTLPGAVGYMYLSQFVGTDSSGGVQLAAGTDRLFMTASEWLGNVSKGPWILDLRHNGGGLITAALNIAGSLLPAHADIIKERSRDSVVDATLEPVERLDTLRGDSSMISRLKGRSIYVLQDRHSASASEIVISALRENLGASVTTIGDTSYGKGIGQIYVQTPLDGYMAITCLHLDPLKASSYHKIGIAPDRKVDSASISSYAWTLAKSGGVASRAATGIPAAKWNLQALDWNRAQLGKRRVPPLKPASPGRPFPVL